MSYISHIDYLIAGAFAAISLILGIRAGRRVQNVPDYILANRSFDKWAVSLSYVCTALAGGGILGTAAKTYSEWMVAGAALLAIAIIYVITALFFIPKIARFKNCLTLGDVIASIYGEKSKIITGIIGFLTVICRGGMNLIWLGIFANMLLGANGTWVIAITAMFLAIYVAYGGIRTIITTDVLQFLALVTIMPMIVYFMLNAVGGIGTIITKLSTQQLPIVRDQHFSYYLIYFLVWNFSPMGMVSNPATMQRLLIAKNVTALKEQGLLAAIFDPLFKITMMLFGLAGCILYPTMPDSMVMQHVAKALFPIGLKGLNLINLFLINTSIIISCLHAAGFTIVHDVIKPICDKKNISINELTTIRWATILASIILIIISLFYRNLYQLFIIPFGLTGPLLLFPGLAGILGLKPNKQAFYFSLISTLITFSVCQFSLPANQVHYTIILTIVASGLTFFSTHLIKNKGFAIINKAAGEEIIWRPRKKHFIASFKQIVATPHQIIKYTQDWANQSGNSYIAFGVLLTLNYLLPYALWTNIPSAYQYTMLVLRLVGGFLCGALILQEKWPKSWVPYLPIFWHLTLLFCIPFTNTLMYLISEGNIAWLINFIGFTVFLYIFLDWISVIIVGMLGIGLGMLYFKVLGGSINFPIHFMDKYLLAYQLSFVCLSSIIFLRKKQLACKKLAVQRDYFKYIQQDMNNRLVETLKYREELLKELDAQQISIFDNVAADYIKQAIYRITDYLRLDVTTITLDNFLEKLQDIPKLQDSVTYPEVYMQHFTKIDEMQADESKLYQVLANSISYIHEYNLNNNPIRILLEDTQLGYEIAHMKNYIKKLEALKITITIEDTLLPKQDIYMIDSSKTITCLQHPQESKQSLIVENMRIIDAHYGYIDVKLPHTHSYVIPVNLRKIRGKVMELLTEPAQMDQDELNHPLAIELEKQLFDKLNNTQIDLAIIQRALVTIKKYHGGVKRKSGEPFFTHPISVALILLDQIQDQDAVVGALLHDTVEDTSLSLTQIKALFGDTVAFIVSKVTNLEDNFRRISLDDYENLHRLTTCEDKRVSLVKLSDRLHNMRTIKHHSSLSKQKKIANETLTFFVPMAKQLKRIDMAEELKKLCVEVLNKEE